MKRALLGAVALAIVAATFFYFLPTIANYGEVWGVVKDLSWAWIAGLLAATAVSTIGSTLTSMGSDLSAASSKLQDIGNQDTWKKAFSQSQECQKLAKG